MTEMESLYLIVPTSKNPINDLVFKNIVVAYSIEYLCFLISINPGNIVIFCKLISFGVPGGMESGPG